MLRGSNYKITKMGIVGTGRIAERFVAEARYASGLIVTSAYNPDIESVNKSRKSVLNMKLQLKQNSMIDFWKM